jgi:hypothetical protein
VGVPCFGERRLNDAKVVKIISKNEADEAHRGSGLKCAEPFKLHNCGLEPEVEPLKREDHDFACEWVDECGKV